LPELAAESYEKVLDPFDARRQPPQNILRFTKSAGEDRETPTAYRLRT
jgi:hypothetical protein